MKEVKHPPKWAERVLRKFCHSDLWEAIEGDLYEIYLSDLKQFSARKSSRNYVLNAIAFLRYHRLRKKNYSTTQNNMDLLQNYLKVSYRDLVRHKTFTAINMVGLVAGISTCLLILQYVLFETSFDRFNKDFDRIYRVYNDRYQEGGLVQHGTITYPTIGSAMAAEYPEIASYTRMTAGSWINITYGDDIRRVEDYLWADEHFFDVFTYPLIAGDAQTALSETGSVAISETFARSLLKGGTELSNLIGQPIKVGTGELPGQITAIFEDVPANSHLQFGMIVSYKSFIFLAGEAADNSFTWSDFYHYLKLKQGADPELLAAKFDDFSEKYFEGNTVSGSVEKFGLQPLSEARLYSDFEYEIGHTSDGRVVWLLLCIALIVLLIAWINFVNLTTSRALQRAREVGVRKVLGAHRKQLAIQFMIESIMVNTLALLLSLGLVFLLQPGFVALTGVGLTPDIFANATLLNLPAWIILAAGFFLLATLVGMYPALVLSRFKSSDVLKGKLDTRSGSAGLRKVLVVFQFTSAIMLITGTISITQQIRYMQNEDLGAQIDNIIVLNGPSMVRFDSTFISRFASFKKSLMSLSGVSSVTSSSRLFSERTGRIFQIGSPEIPDRADLTSSFIQVDYDFVDHFKINLLAGRSFELTDHNTDFRQLNTVLVNKSASELMHFNSPEEAIGKSITFWGNNWRIVGVTDDFHQRSLKESIEPIILMPAYSPENYISVRLEGSNSEEMLSAIRSKFDEFYPGNYFDYFFMDEFFNRAYSADKRLERISEIFTGLAIIIAMLGLYGLVLMMLIKKTKEIGIRKVLGASLPQLMLLVVKDFGLLLVAAILIGLPSSYFILKEWMQNYAYSNGVQWSVFLLSSAILLSIALATITLQTDRISKNNPVDSLKYE
ncbi:FtsX-like permease family protein [Imperialibacter roseus]|uniref:FtsX-like permease family protein n=1 Tax=Imperialibacter roseus TaxID=1324217 RepID=A0ABZ0IXE0_9BACT|nr:ABC transporter permease [Imperialibacter roseus]WOK08804.1 FtsX-like permease family protein [Imperialibacter roseus]